VVSKRIRNITYASISKAKADDYRWLRQVAFNPHALKNAFSSRQAVGTVKADFPVSPLPALQQNTSPKVK
jgi:hypothetical protein